MISVHFQGKLFHITVIQVCIPTSNAKKAEVDQFYADLQDLLVNVQLLSRVQLLVTPWTATYQGSLSFTISLNLLKLMFIESEMPSNHLTLCFPLLLPSIFPSIRVFSNELAPIGSYISLVRVHFTFYHFLFSCSNSLLFEDKGYMTLVH